MIDYDLSGALDEILSESLIESGLSDALLETSQRFNLDEVPLASARCLQTVRKLFGMAVLAIFTSRSAMLHGWAASLREEVVWPLVVQLKQGVRNKDIDGIVIMHLDVTTALIASIPVKDGDGLDSTRPSLATIGHLAGLCYMQYDWAWEALRLFDWLAAYLSRDYGIKGISAGALKDAAIAVEEKGIPFVLAGFCNEGPTGENARQ